MKAVIMAGGEGTRLRPLTCNLPKPMVNILNKPIMEHILNLLVSNDINDISVTLCYLPEIIKEYFEDGSKYGVNLHYFIENSPLGTGGSVLNTGDFLNETFVVISGDALTDIDLKNALEYHKSKKSLATLILKKESIPLEYGIVITNKDGKIIRFLEKPSWGEVFSDTVNTGIYILEPEIFKFFNKGDSFDFSKDLFPKLLNNNIPMYGFIMNSYWSDIGDISSYMQSNFDILDKKVKISSNFPYAFNQSYGSVISEGAIINEPVFIGQNCVIKNNTTIGPYAIIEDNTIVSEGTSVKKSIISKNTFIGRGCQIRGSVICSNSTLKDNINIFEDCVIGSDCVISKECLIKPGIKVWPNKYISENTILNRNLVWGNMASRNFFGNRGITGIINIDITPEFSSLLGSGFASVINKQEPFIISSDSSNTSLTVKSSIISGILSAGKNVIDCDCNCMPAFRYAASFYKTSGGIHIMEDLKSENTIHIELIDSEGCNIDRKLEKKLEQVISREDFKRSNSSELGEISKTNNFDLIYINSNLNILNNINLIQNKSPEILVASYSENILNTACKYYKHVGCKVHKKHLDISNINNIEVENILSQEICKGNYFMGLLISESGDNLILFNERGEIIEDDKYNVLSSIMILKQGAKKILLPYNTTRIVEKLAVEYNAQVIRTKSSISDFMKEILNLDSKDCMQLQYIFNFDAILAGAKILDYLVGNSLTAKDFFDEIPKFYMRKNSLECNFNDMGRIIRKIVEENKNTNVELFEGVKVNNDKGWVLILPDNEKPIFKIYTEGFSQEYADEISADITSKIKNLINQKS